MIEEADKKDWKLKVLGNGPLKEQLQNHDDIEVIDFVQPEEFENIIKQSGCLLLPSIKEPWALVLHEFSAAGLPIIASNVCGSIPYFLINGYNGFVFENKNFNDLKQKMEKIIQLSDSELFSMGVNSNGLGQRITPEIVAFNSLSIVS